MRAPLDCVGKEMPADFRIVWFAGFEHATVAANSEHAALWLGRRLDRAGLAVYKINLSGSAADKIVAAAEEGGFEIEQVDLATLRPAKPAKPPSRVENQTQKIIVREVKSGG